MSTVSGIVSRPAVSGSSQRVIPQTRRADGSLRPERKVRAGYVPAEDVTRYANEKVSTAARLAPGEVIGYTPPANKTSAENRSKSKKKKKAKKVENEAESVTSPSSVVVQETTAAEEPATTDPVKKLKNLKKKLRQAEQLKVKLEAGETLLDEQLEKIDKMEELTNEIAQLEVR